MLKLIILLLIVILVAIAFLWGTLRRRLKLGVRVGIALYAILMVARLSQVKTDQETLANLVVILGLFGALWLAAWVATSWIASRKT